MAGQGTNRKDILLHCFVPIISAGVEILTLMPEIDVRSEDFEQPFPDKHLFNIHQQIGRLQCLQLPIPVAAHCKQQEIVLYVFSLRKHIKHIRSFLVSLSHTF